MARLLSGVTLTPFLLKKCNVEEISAWYTIIAIGAVAIYFELGLAQNISRFVSQAWAGVKELREFGLEVNTASGSFGPNLQLVVELQRVAWVGAILLAFIASIFLAAVAVLLGPDQNAFWSSNLNLLILMQGVNVLLNIIARVPLGIMQGAHRIRQAAHLQLIVTCLQFVASVLVVMWGAGVIGVLAAQAGGAGALLLMSAFVTRKMLSEIRPVVFFNFKILRIVWPLTWRLGVSGFAGNLMSQSVFLLGAHSTDPAILAGFGVLHQLISVVFGVVLIPSQIVMPTLLRFRLRGEQEQLVKIGGGLVYWSLAVFIVSSIVIAFAMPVALNILGSQVHPLPWQLTLLYVVIRALEVHHCIYVVLIMSGNRAPFVILSIISCLCIYLPGWFWARELGLTAVLGLYGAVQLMGSNWLPSYLFLKESGPNCFRLIIDGVLAPRPLIKQILSIG